MNHDNKVVRCANCGLRFMLTAEDAKCRFCKTEYVTIVEKFKIFENLPAQAGKTSAQGGSASGGKKKMVK